jgi:hypothetical protein
MGAIKDGYDIGKDAIKGIVALAKKNKSQEMLELALAVQEKLIELQGENWELKEKIKDLSHKDEMDKDVIRNPNGFLTKKSEEGKNLNYCGSCYGSNGYFIPLTPIGNGQFICPQKNCQTIYQVTPHHCYYDAFNNN